MTEVLSVWLVIASISYTIAWTGIFEPVREVLGRIHPKVDSLLHCPYCLSHWVAAAVLGVLGPEYWLIGYNVVSFLITVFAATGFSGLAHFVMLRAYEPVAKREVTRTLERLRNQLGE